MGVTQQDLQKRFLYSKESGLFLHRIATRNKAVGDVAGKRHNAGYWAIAIDGKTYLAHRLAWLYMTGAWPVYHIDHIDLNRLNNTFSNLRDVDRRTNQQNAIKAKSSNKTSGLLGVSLCKKTKRWLAQIRISGVKKNLGRFDTPELGYAAYLAAKREFHIGNTL